MPARRDRPRGARLLSSRLLGLGWGLLGLGTASVALYTVPSLQLANRYTVMAAAFIPYGLAAFAGASLIFATSPRRWLKPVALLALAGVAAQVWWAKPYWPAPAAAQRSASTTILTMNMRCNPPGAGDLVALVDRIQPDVAVVQGLWAEGRETLGSKWGQLLPYRTFHPMPTLPDCGTFVLSRTPLRELSSAGEAQPIVEVDRPDGPVVLLPVDFPTPSNGVAPWLDAFTDLSEAATARTPGGKPLVAVGDFNAVREHAPMRRLLNVTGLRDAAEVAGAGWTPTFPSSKWHPSLLGLDHALISADMEASEVRTEGIEGQEHRALVVKIGRS